MSYYNTNKERGETLERSERKAQTQEEKILHWMQRFEKEKLWTPEEIHYYVFSERPPLTSVRRAMTNLATRGLIERSKGMKMGKYGKMIHTWRLASDNPQLELF